MNFRDKKIKISPYLIIAILSLAFSVCGISTAYVAVTNISTSGFLMKASKWDVHFENLSNVYIEGDVKEINRPVINNKSTNINSFRVDFYGNGSATYLFDVVNDGTFDAFISSITIFKPMCISGSYEYDENSLMVCKGFSYKLTYLDDTDVMVSDLLPKNSKKTLKLIMQYDGMYVPSNVVRISDISASVIYSEKNFKEGEN